MLWQRHNVFGVLYSGMSVSTDVHCTCVNQRCTILNTYDRLKIVGSKQEEENTHLADYWSDD